MTHDRYPKKCYLQLKSHANLGRDNWAFSVKTMLFKLGFGNIWEFQENLNNADVFLLDIRNRLLDTDMQKSS